jgi:hypothetical protein
MKLCFFAICAVFLLCACRSKPPAVAERSIPNQESVRPPEPVALTKAISRPPSPREVEAVLHHIFGDAVVADKRDRWYVIGDFNGDGSLDLAARVRPAKLAAVNDPLANWTIQDASRAFFPPAGATVVYREKGSRPTVHRDESLLAVIHGYGTDGWRNPQARQAYLVAHDGGGSLEAASAAHHVRGAPISMDRSQVIAESEPKTGFLFWTGAQYAWHTIRDAAGSASLTLPPSSAHLDRNQN